MQLARKLLLYSNHEKAIPDDDSHAWRERRL